MKLNLLEKGKNINEAWLENIIEVEMRWIKMHSSIAFAMRKGEGVCHEILKSGVCHEILKSKRRFLFVIYDILRCNTAIGYYIRRSSNHLKKEIH